MAKKQIDASGIFEEFFVEKREKNITNVEEAFENFVDDESIQENVSPRIILRVILIGS